MRNGVEGGGAVGRAVNIQRFLGTLAVVEEIGETIRQAEIRGDLGAVIGTAKNPDFRRVRPQRLGADNAERVVDGQRLIGRPGLQIPQHGRESIRRRGGVGVEGDGCAAIRPGGAADAKVDPAGGDGFQHAELLRHFQRRIMRQHDAGTADTDGGGGRGNGGHQDFRRGTGHRVRAMVLGNPVAGISQRLTMLG